MMYSELEIEDFQNWKLVEAKQVVNEGFFG